jgi:eukaryotic-like serine/threonine-protein kinase
MRFFHFLVKKKFYTNLGLALLLTGLLFLLVFLFLNIFTRHGDTIIVPDFKGSSLEKIQNENLLNEFRFVIMDSIYDPSREKGTIIQQDPLAYAKVKKGRKVYITIVATLTEKVSMPNLIDLSLRQALVELKSAHLNINYLDYVEHFAENAVLEQLYLGELIEPGTLIEINSPIDLVIGKGNVSAKVAVPFLIGKTIEQAHDLIYKGTFNLGKEYFMDDDEDEHLRVFKQSPDWDNDTLLPHGDFINLWFRSDINFDFDEYLESLFPDTTAVDTLLDPLELNDLEEYEEQ